MSNDARCLEQAAIGDGLPVMAKNWSGFRIEGFAWLGGFTVRAWDKNSIRAGLAQVSIDGDRARLGHIYVLDLRVQRFEWFPWFKRRINYRGQGLGTQLLQCVVSICRLLGVRELSGEMGGDLDALTRFYQRHGFAVNAELITLNIPSPYQR